MEKSARNQQLLEELVDGRPTPAPGPHPAAVLIATDDVDPPDLASRHIPRLDPAQSRVVSSRRQRLLQHIHRVHFAIPLLGRGFVDVEQPSGRIVRSDLGPFRRRRISALVAGGLALVGLLALTIAYVQRGAWYAEFGYVGSFALVLASGLALALGAWLSSHYRRLSRAVPWTGAGLSVLAFFIALVTWVLPRPSVALGQSLVAAGDITMATLTARALANRGDHAGAEAVRDAIAMAGVRSGGLEEALGFLGRPHQESSYEEEARAAVHDRAPAAVQAAIERCNAGELVSLANRLRPVEPELASEASNSSALCPIRNALALANPLEADRALEVLAQQRPGDDELEQYADRIGQLAAERSAALLASARNRELPGAEQVRLLEEARPLLEVAHRRGQEGRELPSLRRLDRDLDRATNRAERERVAAERARAAEARAAAEAQARREREARRREARRAPPTRRRSTGRLRCRDGTLSPSCRCGGSHRGCCSHHGGVAGCG